MPCRDIHVQHLAEPLRRELAVLVQNDSSCVHENGRIRAGFRELGERGLVGDVELAELDRRRQILVAIQPDRDDAQASLGE